MRGSAASPLARTVDLVASWNATDDDVAARLRPEYRVGIGRAPDGDVVFRGLPFALGRRESQRRWLLVDREVSVPVRDARRATYLVVAHFCDSSRGPGVPDPPVGWIVNPGENLATYEICDASGRSHEAPIRRRYEIADGIIGWGSLPFAAVGHRKDEVLDWRGPHPRQPAGGYPPTGQSGSLGVLPAAWGASQTGVADFVPSGDGDITLWLHAIPLPDGMSPAEIRLRPTTPSTAGTAVVVAGLTLFDGAGDPLDVRPRRQLRVEGFGGALPDVDLGIAIRSTPAVDIRAAGDGPFGWGRGSLAAKTESREGEPHIVDFAAAADARISFGERSMAVVDLEAGRAAADGIRIQALPAPDIRVSVSVDADGERVPSRVRFVSEDGRYLPPLGHRDEVNPGLYEDTGADLVLDRETYAYVPGTFEIDLPPGRVQVEVLRGFGYRPVRRSLVVDTDTRALTLTLDRVAETNLDAWTSADPHVHFLAPSTALLQAAAEDVALVHLLATQWGDNFTSVTDLPFGGMRDPSGGYEVVVGTENRQNMLGHVGLLGAHRPVLPLASGGAPEGRIAAAVTELMADWMDRCRAEGGVVIASHFPLPYAEIAADIVMGKVDAVEMQAFPPAFDTPSILEWYRFLNCGHRIPVVGGTDKMSAEIPLGAIRTYARTAPDAPRSFDAWAAAVRAGRTFATSGPLIELSVDGRDPGDLISMTSTGGTLEAHVTARAAQPVISAVELVINGRVVADATAQRPAQSLDLHAPLRIEGSAWIAARARSPYDINSAFATSMAAHTSPVYVDVPGEPLFMASDAEAILAVIDGTLTWLRDHAAVARESDRQRMVEFVATSAARLRSRIDASERGVRG